jgi:hypothetical protein
MAPPRRSSTQASTFPKPGTTIPKIATIKTTVKFPSTPATSHAPAPSRSAPVGAGMKDFPMEDDFKEF